MINCGREFRVVVAEKVQEVLSLGSQPVRDDNGEKSSPPSGAAPHPGGAQILYERRSASQSSPVPAMPVPAPARYDFSVERGLKRGCDLVGSFLLAIVFSPIFLLVFVCASVNRQAALFRHQRVGRDGRLFYCIKFQTMVPDAEQVLKQLLDADPQLRAEWDRDHKLKSDPRVTRLGRFLRATSLDEIPQLWNVLKGDMSLVGPRPVTRQELLRYGRNSVIYEMVRPGITGLWQVSGRNFVEYRRRVAMDVIYVKRQSFVLDIWILLKTVVVVITGHGAF